MSENNFNSSANTDAVISLECQEVIERLGDFLDKDLAPAYEGAVEKHLNGCAECSAFFASYRHVVDSAAELRQSEKELGVDVQNRLRKALTQRLGLSLSYIA